jgi:hypothetical protein
LNPGSAQAIANINSVFSGLTLAFFARKAGATYAAFAFSRSIGSVIVGSTVCVIAGELLPTVRGGFLCGFVGNFDPDTTVIETRLSFSTIVIVGAENRGGW